MYWIILLFAAVNAANLNNYLPPPPPNAKEAGGHEDDLQVPLEPPYVDSYNYQTGPPIPEDASRYANAFRGYNKYRPNKGPFNWETIEDEDQIKDVQESSFRKTKSRFLYGSYSYTGPDNILVTVTYTADRDRPQHSSFHEDEDYNEQSYSSRPSGNYNPYELDRKNPLEAGVIPTPLSLPGELEKAFAFHRKKYLSGGKKGQKKGYNRTSEPKQPWDEQPTNFRNQKPRIDQGYSYPKVTAN